MLTLILHPLLLLPLQTAPIAGPGTPAAVTASLEHPPITDYAALDEALEGEELLPLGTVWRFLPGYEDPCELPLPKSTDPLPWTLLDYDDEDWNTGVTPIGYGDERYATQLPELEGVVSTLYLRHAFEIADPSIYEDVRLLVRVDDGYVSFLNGEEEGRASAGILVTPPFDTLASSERNLDGIPVPYDTLTDTLEAGWNQLALQVHVFDTDRQSFGAMPTVYGWFRKNLREDQARADALRSRLAGPHGEALALYLEGRVMQRNGRNEDAARLFLAAAELDPTSVQPWERLVASRRAQGKLPELEADLAQRVRGEVPPRPLLDAWTELFLEVKGGSPTELRSFVFRARELPTAGYFADALWAGERLRNEEPLRIDCGAPRGHGTNGDSWSRDRFYTYGEAKRQGLEAWPWSAIGRNHGVVRLAKRPMGTPAPLYRIPLARGAYSIALSFVRPDGASAKREVIDVFVDERRVTRVDTKYETHVRFPFASRGGIMTLDLASRLLTPASIATIEITPLARDELERLSAAWGEHEPDSAYAHAQLGMAAVYAKDLEQALRHFEDAERRPGFLATDAETLAWLRLEVAPRVLSPASADAIARLPKAKAREIQAAFAEQAETASEERLAAYLDGRIAQWNGHPDDAIALFEELVFGDADFAEPFLAMAECLRSAGLAEEAADIMRGALDQGLPLTEEFLNFYLALQIDELDRTPWEIVDELAGVESELPRELVLTPTSEHAPQTWDVSPGEPPSTQWSRPSYPAPTWDKLPGGLGWGSPPGGQPRTYWKDATIFARKGFELPANRLLYPYARVNMNDAGDIYLNGTNAHRVHTRTDGYDMIPIRKASFGAGLNMLGIYAINVRNDAYADIGIVIPIEDLLWVHERLATDSLRMNCGGGDYVDAKGRTFYGDRFYGHGGAYRYPVSEDAPLAKGTEDDELYRMQRAYPFAFKDESWYKVPVQNGSYEVTLHFIELFKAYAEAGKRVFDVAIEEDVVLKDFDMFATAGFATAIERTFETKVTDGWLDIELKHKKMAARISAIEILAAD